MARGLVTGDVGRACGAAALSSVLAALVLQLWNAPLHIPWVYSLDGHQYGLFVKSILDHGWHYENANLGAPEGQRMYDYPIASGENLQALVVRMLGLVFDDWAAVMNVYFLLTFPLAAVAAYAIFRRLGSAGVPAVVCATLFSLLPYHFDRGQRELFVSGYFAVPLGAYLVLAVLSGEPLFARRAGAGHPLLAYVSGRSLLTVGGSLAVVLASGSFYYAMFTLLLVAAAAALGLLLRRSWRAVVPAGIVLVIVTLGVLASLAPTLAYRFEHGANELVRTRGVNESEIFALKLTQLVLPIEEHRVDALAERSSRYAETAPFGQLGGGVHLGLVATAGFVWLLVVAVAGAAAGTRASIGIRYRPAAVATLVAFLVGTVGGISALIAAALTPQFRAWNRISIFIAFFSLVAVALALTALGRRWRHGRRRPAYAVVLAAVLVVGVLDQTSSAYAPPYEAIRSEYSSDAQFVRALESQLPSNAAVLQLPYVPFPEAGRTGALGDYDLARPYFHTNDLRWSFGAMKGRPEDWLGRRRHLDSQALLASAVASGFTGLYIDRAGYEDRGAALESRLSTLPGLRRSLVSRNGRLVFYDLRDYRP